MRKSIVQNNKYYLFGVFALLFFNQCNSIKGPEHKLEIQISLVPYLKEPNTATKLSNLYSMKIKFVNNTDSVIGFLAMNCSWEDNFIYNKSFINMMPQDCDNNSPTLYQIMPAHEIEFTRLVTLLDRSKVLNKNKVEKIGFVFIREHEYIDDENFVKQVNERIITRKDIIWSTPLISI
jgi:hypothetical protein